MPTHQGDRQMDKKLTSISDLMNEMGIDKDIAKKVTDNINNHSVSQSLTILRAKADLSQAEMAKKMGVSQSFISKLEVASNDQIKFGDFNKFVNALGYDTTLTISKPQNIVQKIKNTYNQLFALTKELQNYAVDDEAILQSIAKFELEATHNMLNLASALIESSASKLNKIHPQQEPQIILEDSIVSQKKKELVTA